MSFIDSITKPALKSIGIWGGIISAAPGIMKLAEALGTIDPTLIADSKLFAVTTFGALLAIIGRWKAELKIKGLL